jgi:hypothetical protein
MHSFFKSSRGIFIFILNFKVFPKEYKMKKQYEDRKANQGKQEQEITAHLFVLSPFHVFFNSSCPMPTPFTAKSKTRTPFLYHREDPFLNNSQGRDR